MSRSVHSKHRGVEYNPRRVLTTSKALGRFGGSFAWIRTATNRRDRRTYKQALHKCSSVLALFLSFILAAPAFAQEAKIVGPATAAPGDLVILTSEGSKGTGHVWRLVNSDRTFLPVDNGTKAVFACGTPGKYTFVLAVALEGKAALAVHTVTIGTLPEPVPPTPQPTPQPIPTPLPVPILTPLGGFVYDAAKTLDARSREFAKPAAQNYRSVAQAIRDNQTIDYNAAIEQLQKATLTEKPVYDAWQKIIKPAIVIGLRETRKGRPATPLDVAREMTEIAAALEAVQ